MIKRHIHVQSTAAALWAVPMGSPTWKRARPLAAYMTNGDSIEIDSWEFENGVLKVNFGLDPVAGELDFEYQVAGDDPVVIEGNGGVVNITVNQHNGGVATQPATFL